MKKLTTTTGKYGPYKTIETLEDRYRVDNADLPFNVIGRGIISDAQPGDFPSVIYVPSEQETADIVRQQRDQLLLDSDWTQLLNYPYTNQADWATYREQLRNVPEQSGFPFNVVWPTAPTN
jgi:hypothetical protein